MTHNRFGWAAVKSRRTRSAGSACALAAGRVVRVALARVARQLGVGVETLRTWVKQAESAGGRRPGAPTEQQRRLAELERENRELRRANEILKAASAFFARELDPRLPR